jgi:phasin family protein
MAKKSESDSFIGIFQKLGRDLKLPVVDIDGIIEANRKNLEAFDSAAKMAAKGAGDMFSRQQAMLEEAARDLVESAKKLSGAKNPLELLGDESDYSREAFERVVKNSGEMASMIQKTGADVGKVLRDRFFEGIEEIKEEIRKRTG